MTTIAVPGLEELLGWLAENASEDKNPHEQIDRVRTARIGALILPVADGGPGASTKELLALAIRLAEADPNVAHILRAHFAHVHQVLRLPAGAVRQRWIEEIRAGKLFGNATSEQGGTQAGSYRFATRLTETANGTVLDGKKFYSTGTLFADLIAVTAQYGTEGSATVFVPTDREGVSLLDDWDGIGQNRTGTGTTVFDNVAVYPEEIVSVRENREQPANTDAALLQLYLQAVMTGILRNVVTDARTLVLGRTRSFEHAPAELPARDPILHETIGELASTAYIAEAAVLAAAGEIDTAYLGEQHGNPDPAAFAAASLAAGKVKVHIDRAAVAAASALFDVGGASAATRSRALDRHWRNIRTLTTHNPTAYKAAAIGDSVLNGTPLPTNGYF
ncbi:acyl-CoA dehydrogenase family protein [Sciscionella marina]|uniref:acyl-CoA dehydrogenase family protein n=1 Tax=Sciscionella marina TaxID=508770 RepID=UPI000382AC58|nr:acyl-CoA dehydrogenase family protein [Sciscionella marina]